MIIANMTWNPRPEKGGFKMTLRLAQILYKLFHITTTLDNGKIRFGIEFWK